MQFYKFTLTVSFDPLVFNLVLWAFPLRKNGGAEKGPPFAPLPFFLGKALGTRLTCVTKKKNLTTKLQTLIKGEEISSACA